MLSAFALACIAATLAMRAFSLLILSFSARIDFWFRMYSMRGVVLGPSSTPEIVDSAATGSFREARNSLYSGESSIVPWRESALILPLTYFWKGASSMTARDERPTCQLITRKLPLESVKMCPLKAL